MLFRTAGWKPAVRKSMSGPGGPRSGYSIFTPASWTIFFHLTFSSAM